MLARILWSLQRTLWGLWGQVGSNNNGVAMPITIADIVIVIVIVIASDQRFSPCTPGLRPGLAHRPRGPAVLVVVIVGHQCKRAIERVLPKPKCARVLGGEVEGD